MAVTIDTLIGEESAMALVDIIIRIIDDWLAVFGIGPRRRG